MNLNAYEVSEIQSTLFRKNKVYLFFQHHGERLVDKGACINICPYPSEFYSEMLTNIIAQIVKECVSI